MSHSIVKTYEEACKAVEQLAERWMEEHNINPLQLSPTAAKAQLFAWLKPRWEEPAVLYLQKKLAVLP